MKITFEIATKSFSDAAVIERLLKKASIRFTSRVDDKPSLGAPKKPAGRRKPITKSELAVIVKAIGDHPTYTDTEMAGRCNVSSATVGRVRSGTHALQVNGSAE